MSVLYVFLLISLLFSAALAAKHLLKNNSLCAICAAIASSWLALLVLYRFGRFHDTVLLALLMGQSVTGIFYLIQKRVPAALRIFTLPFFLTLTAVFYILITSDFILPAFGLLSGLWLLAWLVFTYRSDPGKEPVAKALMDCCGGKE